MTVLLQDEGVRGGEREERPPDPRARQEEQPLGGEGQVRHHVKRGTTPPAKTNNRLLYPGLGVFCTYAVLSVVQNVHVAAPGLGPTTPHFRSRGQGVRIVASVTTTKFVGFRFEVLYTG